MEHSISEPVKRIDVPDKILGNARYTADLYFPDMLYARTLRSTQARAVISAVRYPELPEGYFIVDKNDVPGRNRVSIVVFDQPFFADGAVNYVGEPIALVVGPDKKEITNILSKIEVEYERLDPILTMEEGLQTDNPIYGKDNLFANYKFAKGDIAKAAQEAEYIFEGEYETGYQEQFYIEPQGVIGLYRDGRITIHGSIQCPYYVKTAVEECMGFEPDRVQIIQTTTGGAFGGKEEYPSLIGGQAACAAYKTGKPVQIIFDRDEDIESTTKRHPSKIRIKSYVDKNYKIIGEETEVLLDAGAYAGLSAVVLQRAVFASIGVYNVENILVKGKAVATNKAVSGAFRGFGGPQAFFAVEMHMEHMAKNLGIDPLEFKMRNLLKQGDYTSTGGIFRDRILLPHMIDRVLQMSSYNEKKAEFKEEKKQGKLKGMGLSLFFHGGGFTGSGEQDIIKAKVKLMKLPDGKVEILVANVEMGQGASTTLRKIVAHTLDIPIENVIYKNPDTDRVPNSGPTVASRTIVIVGRLLEKASEKLKNRWNEKGIITVEERYIYPQGFSWDGDRLYGDAYTSYSWGVNAVEVEVDPVTYESSVKGVWAAFDIGNAIDERIVKGQIDGGIAQGLGYGSLEVMESRNGHFMQRNASDYIIPTSMDMPPVESELICEPYDDGPLGAKALGELTLVGAPAAYALSVEDALGIDINCLPVRPEYLMEVVHDGKHH